MAENELEASLREYLEENTAQTPIKYIKVRGKTHRLHGIKVFEHISDIMNYEKNTGKEFDDQDVAGAEALKEVNDSITTTINTVVNPKIANLEKSFSEALTNLKNTPIAKAIGASGTTFTSVINQLNSIVNRGYLLWSPSSRTSRSISPGFYTGGYISTANAYDAGYNSGYDTGSSNGYTSGYSTGKSDGYSSGYSAGKSASYNSLKTKCSTFGSRGNFDISVSGEIVAYVFVQIGAGGTSVEDTARIARRKVNDEWVTDYSKGNYSKITASDSYTIHIPSMTISAGYMIVYKG